MKRSKSREERELKQMEEDFYREMATEAAREAENPR